VGGRDGTPNEQAKHMDSWIWACPDAAEENTGSETGGEPKGKVEDAELEAVKVMYIKELKLLWALLLYGLFA